MIMVLGLFPTTAVTAHAVSKLTTSTRAIEILMEKQGFEANEYWSDTDGDGNRDDNEWFIGYGSNIKKGSYPNGISKEDAIALVRKNFTDANNPGTKIDDKINEFTKKNNLDLTQYEHDALALFCYRTGSTTWLANKNHSLYQAVITGKTGNEFINIMANAGSVNMADAETLAVVMNYRLSEANMYLNNSYGYYAPSSMIYVVLDHNGDEKVNSGDELLAFSTAKDYKLPVANSSTFLGWYVHDGEVDGKIAGAPITSLDKDNKGDIIVAKYGENKEEVFADYTVYVAALPNRYLFEVPYTKADMETYKDSMEELYTYILAGNTFEVSLETIVDGSKWVFGTGVGYNSKGKVNKQAQGWLYLGELIAGDNDSALKPIATATVTSNELNIREGATTDSDIIGKLKKDVTVSIYEIKIEKTETGNQSWGKIINTEDANGDVVTGWINLVYTDVNETSGSNDSVAGMTGKIVNADNVNVRKDPVIENSPSNVITTLKKGTKVTVLETKMNGEAQWGYVEWSGLKDGYTRGWVYMYYVELDDAAHSKPQGGNSTSGAWPVLYTGVVSSNINLNVRNKPSASATRVGSLTPGTKINIYEVKKASNGVKWGAIDENKWVCLDYVTLTKVENSGSDSTATTSKLQGTVTSVTLDVMQNYNSNAAKVGSLKKGDVVTILEKNTEETETGSRIWGRISTDSVAGWINLAYVDLKTVTSVNGNTSTGSNTNTNNANGANAVISNCISVNVRKGAGVTKEQITKLNNGTPIKVYEQVTKDNAPWALITWNNGANEGWVCMHYVTMASSSSTATDGTTINGTNSNTISATGYVNSNVNLKVRAGAGLGYAELGSLVKGTKVTVYEQVTGDGMIWGRIPYGNGSGWICMSYVTVESTSTTGKGVMGTIARCFAAVNVRSAPGTNNALVGTIAVGKRVEVFETREHAGQMWGRVAQGWVCMDYVLLDSELPPGTVLDATEPTTQPTQTPDETVNKKDEVAFVIEAQILRELNVRNDATVNSDRVGTVNAGMLVDIRAVKNNGAELWGRIDQYATAGWILMDKDNVAYILTRYVAVDEQPIYQDANTGSTVKGTLPINQQLIINKVTTNGTDVYGWVEEGIYGWIPLNKTSEKAVDVMTVYKSGDHVGNDTIYALKGKTFAAMDAVDSIGGSRVLFKMESGVHVYVESVKFENGRIWGYVQYDLPGADSGEYGYAWIDVTKLNYTLPGTIVNTTELNVRSTMNINTESNIITTLPNGTAVQLCQFAFDSNGNIWARLNGNFGLDPDRDTNGAFVMVKSSASGVNAVITPNTTYVQTAITP